MIAKRPAEFYREIFIGLGSNLGAREEWLGRAREDLQKTGTIRLVQQSALYETEPVGMQHQPGFLNQVIAIATALSPAELLEKLLECERQLGRVRQQRWGPRTIDLDLLAFADVEMDTASLILPHAEIARRRFVLAPWSEIAPAFVVPRWQLTVAELLARCEDRSRVVKLAKI